MTDETHTSEDERLVLRDIRALLDQLQLDRDHSLTMQSKLTDDLGVDSLALVELCDQFERTFDVTLPDEVFLQATTPQQWLDAVVAARGGEATPRHSDQVDEVPTIDSVSVSDRLHSLSRRLVSAARSARDGRGHSEPGSWLYSIYAWIVLIPFAVSIWSLAVLPLSLPRRREAGRAIARVTCRALGLSVVVDGELPDSARPYVIAANHSSFIDGLVLYVFLEGPVTFVSSTDMEHQFLLGRIMRGFGCVFVDRGRAERSAASVEILVDTIRSGKHLLIFPEGSISAQSGLRVFHLGAFETATSSNCPIVPVGIRGSRSVLSPGSFRSRPGHVKVSIGAPVMPAGNDFSDRVAMRDQVRDAIARLCGEES
ncbi:MAG: 1-acyl-sn-glycerol-3-phosphate acyltransferase [Acidimicrobiales bacterium]|jgi:acyl carrier protein